MGGACPKRWVFVSVMNGRTLAFEITSCCWKSWTPCFNNIEHENFYEIKGCSPSNRCRNSSINSMKTISWLKSVSMSKRCLPRLISSSNCIQQKQQVCAMSILVDEKSYELKTSCFILLRKYTFMSLSYLCTITVSSGLYLETPEIT